MKCFSVILQVIFFGIQIHNLKAIGFYFSIHALCGFFFINFCCLLFPLINALVYDGKETRNKKKEKYVFVSYFKKAKVWHILKYLMEHFIKHKPHISEE